MDSAAAPASAPIPGMFEDGLGKRRHVSDPAGNGTLEVLCLRDELTAVPAFEFALRERTSRLASFRQASFGHVRSIDRLAIPASSLAVVSEYTPGVRLSTLLATPERRRLDLNASLHLSRQLLSAVALLHKHEAEISHGAIAPERIVITPNARLVLVEYVLGGALEQLHYPRERYWSDLRVATPSGSEPRFDQRTDVAQLGVVVLSLVSGRLLDDDEYLSRLDEVVANARTILKGSDQPLPPGLRAWLSRALQLDAASSFASGPEAASEFDRMLENDAAYAAQSAQPAVRAKAPEPAPKAVEPEPVEELRFAHVEPQVPYSDPEPAVETPSGLLSSLRGRLTPPMIGGAAAVVVAVVVAGSLGVKRFLAPASLAAATGKVNVSTNPPGAEVFIDGRLRGVSPVSVTLSPGPHALELHGSGGPRTMTFNIAPGAVVGQFIDMPAEAPQTGQVQVRTEPAGAQVTIDDVQRGPSPVTVDALEPGDHVVVVTSAAGTVKQHVKVAAGATASVVVPLPAETAAPASGWIAVEAPAEVQLFENNTLVGTSESDRLTLAAGRHQLELVNEALGYRATRVVQVVAGKVTPIKIDWPKGAIALNATPWAEVWVDGQKIGDTPIGNLSLPIGAHEVVFRHPELGEQRHAVNVTAGAPARLSVDMRKK